MAKYSYYFLEQKGIFATNFKMVNLATYKELRADHNFIFIELEFTNEKLVKNIFYQLRTNLSKASNQDKKNDYRIDTNDRPPLEVGIERLENSIKQELGGKVKINLKSIILDIESRALIDCI